jgi:hypothetical protein
VAPGEICKQGHLHWICVSTASCLWHACKPGPESTASCTLYPAANTPYNLHAASNAQYLIFPVQSNMQQAILIYV